MKTRICPIEELGIKSQKVHFIPIIDKKLIRQNKALEVKEGSKLYMMLLTDNKLPQAIIID